MRITQNMMVGNFLVNLNNNYREMDKIQQQLSTGSRITKPSDDPVAVVSSLRLRSALVENEQYINNSSQALAWLTTTDSALNHAGDILQSVRELVVRGANDTMPQTSRDALAKEIDELREQLLQVANTTHDGRFIFGGHKTTQPPFVKNVPPAVTYNGDAGDLQYELGIGITMSVNVKGDEVFNNGVDVFQVLNDISNELRSGTTADISSLGGVRLGQLDNAIDNLLSVRADVGARINRLELTKARLEDAELNISTLLSKNEDINVAETITQLKMQEDTYQTALAAGARIIQPTLLDFLR